MFTSVDQVRQQSGLKNPTKIPDTTIVNKIQAADSLVAGALAQRYIMPLPSHRQSSIVFSGTGSGSGTLNIVVNGVTYPIAITNLMTSGQVANLFASVTSEDFVTYLDSLGSKVTLVSKKDSLDPILADAQVTIVPPSPTAGITSVVGLRLDRFPPIVSLISAEIAAILLLNDNWGIEAENTAEDVTRRMKMVDNLLSKLKAQEDDDNSSFIIDELSQQIIPLRESSEYSASSYPNPQSDASPINNTSPYVTMGMVF